MNEYKLNNKEDRIVVDSHVCTVMYSHVYSVDDAYFVNIDDWCRANKNSGLHIAVELDAANGRTGKALFISNGSRGELERVVREARWHHKFDIVVATARQGYDGSDDTIVEAEEAVMPRKQNWHVLRVLCSC